MKYFILLISLIFTLNLFSNEQRKEYVMVKKVTDNLFSKLTPEVLSDQNKIDLIVKNNLSEYIDFNFISLKILGRNFRKYPKEEIKEFVNVMEPYLLGLFSHSFSFYNNQEIIISPNVKGSGKITTVSLKVVEPNKPDINLIFKLRENSKTGEIKVYDLIAEGISMVDSKRSELTPLIRKEGLKGAIQKIKEKV